MTLIALTALSKIESHQNVSSQDPEEWTSVGPGLPEGLSNFLQGLFLLSCEPFVIATQSQLALHCYHSHQEHNNRPIT